MKMVTAIVKPFKLEEDKYRFQLGEMAGGKTSITLFDKDKKQGTAVPKVPGGKVACHENDVSESDFGT